MSETRTVGGARPAQKGVRMNLQVLANVLQRCATVVVQRAMIEGRYCDSTATDTVVICSHMEGFRSPVIRVTHKGKLFSTYITEPL